MSEPAKAPPVGRALATLSLGALGVVYGDIGTSPLYALKECFSGEQGFPVNAENVLPLVMGMPAGVLVLLGLTRVRRRRLR